MNYNSPGSRTPQPTAVRPPLLGPQPVGPMNGNSPGSRMPQPTAVRPPLLGPQPVRPMNRNSSPWVNQAQPGMQMAALPSLPMAPTQKPVPAPERDPFIDQWSSTPLPEIEWEINPKYRLPKSLNDTSKTVSPPTLGVPPMYKGYVPPSNARVLPNSDWDSGISRATNANWSRPKNWSHPDLKPIPNYKEEGGWSLPNKSDPYWDHGVPEGTWSGDVKQDASEDFQNIMKSKGKTPDNSYYPLFRMDDMTPGGRYRRDEPFRKLKELESWLPRVPNLLPRKPNLFGYPWNVTNVSDRKPPPKLPPRVY